MGDKVTLKLEERQVHGKKVARLRRDGITPGVVYGAGFEPISVQADERVMSKTYVTAGRHHPVHLTIGSKKKIAMIKHADVDPVKNSVRHLSFHAVKHNEKVEAAVPVHLLGEGESAAEKAGLVILQNIEELEVRALPGDLPDALEVDISKLAAAGDRVFVADIKLPAGIELVDVVANPDDEDTHSVTELVVASAYEPSALQAANDAAGGDAEAGDEAEVAADQGEEAATESAEDSSDSETNKSE